MFNSHVHTEFSRDCTESAEAMCISAVKNSLKGITFTDHINIASCITDNAYSVAVNSTSRAREVGQKFSGQLIVLKGLEMGDILCMPSYANRIIKATNPDFVLASVHAVPFRLVSQYLSEIDFSKITVEELDYIINIYFDICLETTKTADFDALAHLTLPFRYINGVYKRGIKIEPYYDKIKTILTQLIARKKALELNTSELSRQIFDFMPNETIIKMYKELGGTLVTIGSDAHKAENVSFGLLKAADLLRENGFKSYVYYKNRKPVEIEL